jgi:hypothetical protein
VPYKKYFFQALLVILAEESDKIDAERRKQERLRGQKQIMISYKHTNPAKGITDGDFATRVKNALQAKGYTVWIDEKIHAGEDWRSNIAQAISESQAVIFICSPHSVQSMYCKEELYYASACKVPIFPLTYEDAFGSLQGGVKLILQRIQWTEFRAEQVSPCPGPVLGALSPGLGTAAAPSLHVTGPAFPWS